MRKKIVVLLAATALCAATANANLITNPSFETGDFAGWSIGGLATSYGVDLDDTSIAGSYYSDSVVNVRSGDYAAWGLVSASSSPPINLILSQTVNVVAGQTYDIGFYLSLGRTSGLDSAGRTLAMRVGGSQVYYFSQTGSTGDPFVGTAPSNFEHHFTSWTASSSGSVLVEFDLNGSGTALMGFSYDDFYMLPGPSSLALLALAGTVTGRRRRRA